MIGSVTIKGYRGLERFQMGSLGRVNLLVGKNNCGKTSVLEALHILSAAGNLNPLWQHCGRRGERYDSRDPRYPEQEIDISHLFTGHELQLGNRFTISAENQTPKRSVTFTIGEPKDDERAEAGPIEEDGTVIPRLTLRLTVSSRGETSRSILLTRRGF